MGRKYAVYYRVSTEKQDLDSQKEALDQWFRHIQPPWDPLVDKVFEYSDHGISGASEDRPGYIKLLNDAFKRCFDTIVVYRLDRMSRNASHAIKIILELSEAGIDFISVTQPVLNLGKDNPFRRTLLAAFAEIAELERESIIIRIKSGVEAARKRGVKFGPPVKISGELRNQVRVLRSEGLSLRNIAKELSISLGSVSAILAAPQAEAVATDNTRE